MSKMKINPIYNEKEDDYFRNLRSEILPLLPNGDMGRVLEVGCGTGDTLDYIKNATHCEWVCGVELFHEAAEEARGKLDEVYEGDIEKINLPIEEGSLDVVLCLDVLEHLIDPWSVVHKLDMLIKPGGVLIASIPNVRHFKASFPLFFLGQWDYRDAGILDSTHLRFFVRETAVKLMECSGLTVDMVKATGFEKGSKSRTINILTFSLFRPFLEVQYLIRAKKSLG
ncbi:MAG: class I SAM-dependent methyltransferase [Deltaproteobacteria bacterium]|nr:class I SAM-dependent methyltransferase [Deltaproteobacteria bacterium]